MAYVKFLELLVAELPVLFTLVCDSLTLYVASLSCLAMDGGPDKGWQSPMSKFGLSKPLARLLLFESVQSHQIPVDVLCQYFGCSSCRASSGSALCFPPCAHLMSSHAVSSRCRTSSYALLVIFLLIRGLDSVPNHTVRSISSDHGFLKIK